MEYCTPLGWHTNARAGRRLARGLAGRSCKISAAPGIADHVLTCEEIAALLD